MPIIRQVLISNESVPSKILLASDGRGVPKLTNLDLKEIPLWKLSELSSFTILDVDISDSNLITVGTKGKELEVNLSCGRSILEHIPRSVLKPIEDDRSKEEERTSNLNRVRYIVFVKRTNEQQEISEIIVVHRSSEKADFKVVYATRDELFARGGQKDFEVLTCLGEKKVDTDIPFQPRRPQGGPEAVSRAIDSGGRSAIGRIRQDPGVPPPGAHVSPIRNPVVIEIVDLLNGGRNCKESQRQNIQRVRLDVPAERDAVIEAAKLPKNERNHLAFIVGQKHSIKNKPNGKPDDELRSKWALVNQGHAFAKGFLGLEFESRRSSFTSTPVPLPGPPGTLRPAPPPARPASTPSGFGAGPVPPPTNLFGGHGDDESTTRPVTTAATAKPTKQDKVYKLVVDSLREGKDLANKYEYNKVEKYLEFATEEKRTEVINLLKSEANKRNRLAWKLGKFDEVRAKVDKSDDTELNTWRDDPANIEHAFNRGLFNKNFEVSARDKGITTPGTSRAKTGKSDVKYNERLAEIKTKLTDGTPIADEYGRQKVRGFVPRTDQDRDELCTLAKNSLATCEMAYYFGRSTNAGRLLDGKLDPAMYTWASDNLNHNLAKALLDQKTEKTASEVKLKERAEAYKSLADLCNGEPKAAESADLSGINLRILLKLAKKPKEANIEAIYSLGKNQSLIKNGLSAKGIVGFIGENPKHKLALGLIENPKVYAYATDEMKALAEKIGIKDTPLEVTIKTNLASLDAGTLQVAGKTKRAKGTVTPRVPRVRTQDNDREFFERLKTKLENSEDFDGYDAIQLRDHVITEAERNVLIPLLMKSENAKCRTAYVLGKRREIQRLPDGRLDPTVYNFVLQNPDHAFSRGALGRFLEDKVERTEIDPKALAKARAYKIFSELSQPEVFHLIKQIGFSDARVIKELTDLMKSDDESKNLAVYFLAQNRFIVTEKNANQFLRFAIDNPLHMLSRGVVSNPNVVEFGDMDLLRELADGPEKDGLFDLAVRRRIEDELVSKIRSGVFSPGHMAELLDNLNAPSVVPTEVSVSATESDEVIVSGEDDVPEVVRIASAVNDQTTNDGSIDRSKASRVIAYLSRRENINDIRMSIPDIQFGERDLRSLVEAAINPASGRDNSSRIEALWLGLNQGVRDFMAANNRVYQNWIERNPEHSFLIGLKRPR